MGYAISGTTKSEGYPRPPFEGAKTKEWQEFSVLDDGMPGQRCRVDRGAHTNRTGEFQ